MDNDWVQWTDREIGVATIRTSGRILLAAFYAAIIIAITWWWSVVTYNVWEDKTLAWGVLVTGVFVAGVFLGSKLKSGGTWLVKP